MGWKRVEAGSERHTSCDSDAGCVSRREAEWEGKKGRANRLSADHWQFDCNGE